MVEGMVRFAFQGHRRILSHATLQPSSQLKGSLSGSVKAKIQKKSQDKAQQKKDRSGFTKPRSHLPLCLHYWFSPEPCVSLTTGMPRFCSAATQLDAVEKSSSKKRRSSSAAESIGGGASSPKRKKDGSKGANLAVAIDTMDDVEKRDRVLHALALRDMNKADLRARLNDCEIPRAIVQEVATWDSQKSLYILKRQLYALVDPGHASYSAYERASVKGRKAAMMPISVTAVTSEEDARGLRGKYVTEHKR